MANLKFNLVSFEGEATLTLFHEGKALVASESHPYWEEIRKGVVVDDDPEVVRLFDLSAHVEEKFQRLTDQITVVGGRVFFDGDEVDNSITRKITECIKEGIEDWQPLANFMQKTFQNPSAHSREQLFDFLANNSFSINENGDVIAYKGLQEAHSTDFQYHSWHKGTDEVTVDGVTGKGYVYQNDGSIVEMPRSAVHHDPATGCSHGLHVSNYAYAKDYGVVVRVLVNPRDFVSVPTEHNWQKARVCRYVVDHQVDAPDTGAVVLTNAKVDEGKTDAIDISKVEKIKVEKTKEDFPAGSKVTLVDNKWMNALGQMQEDLVSRWSMTIGETYTVKESAYGRTLAIAEYNVLLERPNGGSIWVHPSSLVLGESKVLDTDVDDEYDSWDDEDDSWEDDSWY